MKNSKRALSVVAMLAMALAPVFAAHTTNAVSITGATTSLDVTREVENVTNPVVNTFTYQVTAADTNPATATNLPANFTIEFNGTEQIVNNKVSKVRTLDMSGIDFPAVGDYEFIIEEIASGNTSIYPIDRTEWYAYVSVRYVMESDGITPTTTMEATLAEQAKAGGTGSKADIVFNSSAEFTNISLSKTVTGNLADINKYFTYEVEFLTTGANTVPDGTQLVVLGAHATGSDCSTIVTTSSTLTVTGGKISLCLKHGQDVAIGLTAATSGIQQLPVGVRYEIAETPEDNYKIYIDGSTSETPSGIIEKTTVSAATDNATAYMNNKEADPVTGIFVNYWPYMLLVALGVSGAVIVKKTSKKNS